MGAVILKNKIHLNQLGYYTDGFKTACYVGKGSSKFSIIDTDGKEVYKGLLTDGKEDGASNDFVFTADFSDFCSEGEYILKVGSLKSYTFKISPSPYSSFFSASLKTFYFSRCGYDLRSEFAGEYKRKKCHTEKAALISDSSVFIDVRGGWHDAGDFGRYTVTASSALAHLLYAYELFPDCFNEKINIPESRFDVPDILSECRFELEWLLKMQDKDGGVFHKVSTKNYPENIMPSEDRQPLFVYDKTTASTADFSAVTALASRIYEKFDKVFSQTLKVASVNAWAWILNNPNVKPYENIDRLLNVEYSDRKLDDDIFWAACELYTLTGNEAFHEKISELFYKVDTTSLSWLNVGGFGALSYIRTSFTTDQMILDSLKSSFIFRADNITSMIKHSGYRTAMSGNRYLWGSNVKVLTYSIILIIADSIAHNKDYIFTAQEQLNYIFGKNPMGKCYVTGFGLNPVLRPHHRPSAADDVEKPIPGMLVGGADMLRSDDYSRWLIPKGTPPSKCYIDEEQSYCSNETAIFFNSPMVFVLAFFKNLYEEGAENERNKSDNIIAVKPDN